MRDPDEWGLKNPRSLYWRDTREGHRMFHAARRRWHELNPVLYSSGRLYKYVMMLDRIVAGESRLCRICLDEYAVALGNLMHCNGCIAIVDSEFRDELAQGSDVSEDDLLAYVVERLERTSHKACGEGIWHPRRVRRRHRACIYSIQCSTSGVAYIGRTIDRARRWKQHRKELREGRHHNWRLQRAYDAHQGQTLIYSVVQDCAGASDQVLHDAELAHIRATIARDGRVFNVRIE